MSPKVERVRIEKSDKQECVKSESKEIMEKNLRGQRNRLLED